jgi:two-component system, OmpR family, sensor histidine kinase BaeS
MRLHLWQRLFLAFAVLSGVALFGFAAWQQQNFRRGFLGYLDEVMLQRLAPASARLAAAYAEHGSWDFLRNNPAPLGEFIEAEAWHRETRPGDEPDRPPPPDDRGEPMGPPPRRDLPPRPPRPRGPPDLMPRLLLLDAAGDRVAGNPRVPADAAAISITLDGRQIGSLRLAPMPQLSGATDLAFAQTQMHSALLAGVAILIGALALAFALARWLLAPVRALAIGTRALAAGDYTQRIAATRSDELGALSRDFNHLAATLEQHRQARRQWGADIAHELRTPLSILRGEIQALQDGVRALTPQALDSLQAECERLGHLIEDLYQLSLADAGALDHHFEPLDLAELVCESLELQRAACADAGLTLEENLAACPPVRGDARRLAQLLDNLLANARRYTDAPGRIRATLTEGNGQVRLVIEDTAPGVPAGALPRLFDRLYRVEHSRNRAAGGAGLGLAICRAIVDAHDGHIVAELSALGGLRVVIDLPKAAADA